MSDLVIVYWRDIPAQVIVGKGRRGSKRQLEERFEQAIDRAAMKVGAGDTDAPGNNITAMTAAIHTDIKDPVKRLRAIYESTLDSKEARSGLSARIMTDLTRHVPAATQVLASRLVLNSGVAARVCNLFVSNVPGPQVQLYMNGARQEGSFGMAPLSGGMGLFIAAPSYNGRMSFSVTSTREILPDIEFFMQCIEIFIF